MKPIPRLLTCLKEIEAYRKKEKPIYGFRVNGKFDKKIFRIDPATPKGKKGPNISHIHINDGKHKYSWPKKWNYNKK